MADKTREENPKIAANSDFRGLMLITGRTRSLSAHAQCAKSSVLGTLLRIRADVILMVIILLRSNR